MAFLSLREASKRYQVSRPTLLKHREKGKITAEKDADGNWQIDDAELRRVYKPRHSEPGQESGDLTGLNNPLPTKLDAQNQAGDTEIEELRRQLAEAEKRAAVAEAQAEEKERFIEELRKDKAELRRLLPAPDETKRKGWWPW